MTLQQAMLNLDDGMPMWLRIAGDTFARCVMGMGVIYCAFKVLVFIL